MKQGDKLIIIVSGCGDYVGVMERKEREIYRTGKYHKSPEAALAAVLEFAEEV